MKYKIGDIVNIDDVNGIKNELYNDAFNPVDYSKGKLKWSRVKKDIKKRVKFKIIAL